MNASKLSAKNSNKPKREIMKTTLTQTGHNLKRLFEDNKIDKEAFDILNERNNQALSLIDVSKPLYGIFRYDDKGYVGYFESEDTANKVLDAEYDEIIWYVDEMVKQD